jgi:rhomboid protease GluP
MQPKNVILFPQYEKRREKNMQELKAFIRSRQKANLTIVGINIVVFLVLSMLGNTENALFMAEHGAAYTPYILNNGEYYRLFTSMFLHFGVQHIFYNMLLLIFMGDYLEKATGKVRYLLIYLLGGIAGNLASVAYDWYTGDYAVSAGASGAIFAVLGALLWVAFCNRSRLNRYGLKRLLLMVVLSVLEGLSTSQIDNSAHIGGLVAGFLLAVILYRRPSEPGTHRVR